MAWEGHNAVTLLLTLEDRRSRCENPGFRRMTIGSSLRHTLQLGRASREELGSDIDVG